MIMGQNLPVSKLAVVLLVQLCVELSTSKQFFVLLAPNILHTGNDEKIIVQCHECIAENLQVSILVNNFPNDDKSLHETVTSLNRTNNYLATANIKIPYNYLSSDINEKQYIIVRASSPQLFKIEKVILISPHIGYIFIQTDKTIYTPNQNVNYRIFSTDQNLDPAEREVIVLFQMADKHEFLREFIEMYRSMPCLWKIKSADYCNRLKKKDAYQKLLELCKNRYPDEPADESSVKKRIQALRTVYKKELNKVQNSTKSGAGAEDVYVPKLWYFELFSFTRDQEVPRQATSMLDLDPVIQPDSPVVHDTEEAVSTPQIEEDSMALVQDNEVVEPPSSSVRTRLTFSGRKRKAPTSATPELVEIAKKVLRAEKDQTKITGFAYYANEKLPTLDPIQRVHAERLMFEVLTQASLGNLDNSYVVTARPQYPQYSWPNNPVPNPIGINPANPNVGAPPYLYTPPRQRGNGNDPSYQQL